MHLSTIDPSSGTYSTPVTFTGTGFGSSQGSGKVWLGSVEGTVVSWSDTEIVAAVAGGSLTGVARVQQDGEWSNALAFTVPSVNAVTLVPNLMNLEVGDTQTIQALDSTGQPVTGLTWDSSDTGIVSLSAADPPVLTAVAAGRVTITAGTASADVMVSATALPPGTVLWSNPGVGAAVYSLVPAVPSSEGVADVFAFHEDGTVEAVTSEGVTAWTADITGSAWYMPGYVVPDFQGGLVYVKMGEEDDSVVRLDGITGQPTTLYTVSREDPRSLKLRLGVHPDGTIFVVAWDWTGSNDALTVMGFDPAGGQKFSVTSPLPAQAAWAFPRGIIVAGDGNAYVPYSYGDFEDPGQMNYLKLLRVSSDGASDKIDVFEWSSSHNPDGPMIGDLDMITNADEGALLSWTGYHDLWTGDVRGYMAMITGGGASVFPTPGQFPQVKPLLQLEDGSFVGDANPWGAPHMIAFDSTGAIRWSVPGYSPKIATSDGGVLAADSSGFAALFDQNGSAVGMSGKLLTQSWIGNTYRVGSTVRELSIPTALATSFAAAADRPAAEPLPDRVKAMYDVVSSSPPVLRQVWYRLYQGNNSYAPLNNAVIEEAHIHSYGPHPLTSESSPGQEFADEISTMGREDFGLTQHFLARIPGKRPYRVQIVPCIANPGFVPPVKFGPLTWRNINIVTSQAVSINGDTGSTGGRECRYIQ